MGGKTLLTVLSLAVLFSAGLTILAHYLHPPRIRFIHFFKPLSIILILAVALLPGTTRADAYTIAICLGLLFSLIGDIWIMWPGRHFLHGLLSFLIAHICYGFAFLTGASGLGFLLAAIPLLLIGLMVLQYLWPGLAANLKGAVSIYVAVIMAMTALALSRAATQETLEAVSAALGALLFMASDAILAIARFRRPFHLSQAVVLASYYAGQGLIALSVGMRALE